MKGNGHSKNKQYTSEYIALPSGFYLLKIIPDNGKTIVRKVLVRD